MKVIEEEEVAPADESEMILSTVPLWQVSYVDNPGMNEKPEERERGEASQSYRVHGGSVVMCWSLTCR